MGDLHFSRAPAIVTVWRILESATWKRRMALNQKVAGKVVNQGETAWFLTDERGNRASLLALESSSVEMRSRY